jgi:hypothetical protein
VKSDGCQLDRSQGDGGTRCGGSEVGGRLGECADAGVLVGGAPYEPEGQGREVRDGYQGDVITHQLRGHQGDRWMDNEAAGDRGERFDVGPREVSAGYRMPGQGAGRVKGVEDLPGKAVGHSREGAPGELIVSNLASGSFRPTRSTRSWYSSTGPAVSPVCSPTSQL